MECTCPRKWQDFFRAIHNRQRQMILEIIRDHADIHEGGIVEKVKLSQPTVSHHLKVLSDASIIRVKKVGKEVVYSINSDMIHECCGGFINEFA